VFPRADISSQKRMNVNQFHVVRPWFEELKARVPVK